MLCNTNFLPLEIYCHDKIAALDNFSKLNFEKTSWNIAQSPRMNVHRRVKKPFWRGYCSNFRLFGAFFALNLVKNLTTASKTRSSQRLLASHTSANIQSGLQPSHRRVRQKIRISLSIMECTRQGRRGLVGFTIKAIRKFGSMATMAFFASFATFHFQELPWSKEAIEWPPRLEILCKFSEKKWYDKTSNCRNVYLVITSGSYRR